MFPSAVTSGPSCPRTLRLSDANTHERGRARALLERDKNGFSRTLRRAADVDPCPARTRSRHPRRAASRRRGRDPRLAIARHDARVKKRPAAIPGLLRPARASAVAGGTLDRGPRAHQSGDDMQNRDRAALRSRDRGAPRRRRTSEPDRASTCEALACRRRAAQSRHRRGHRAAQEDRARSPSTSCGAASRSSTIRSPACAVARCSCSGSPAPSSDRNSPPCSKSRRTPQRSFEMRRMRSAAWAENECGLTSGSSKTHDNQS
jgi:hypothetical protein